MSHALVAAILVGHGLITSMIGFGAVTSPNAPAMALPSERWPLSIGLQSGGTALHRPVVLTLRRVAHAARSPIAVQAAQIGICSIVPSMPRSAATVELVVSTSV